MKNKFFFLILTSLFLFLSVSAQKFKDVIYLKDGSVYRGYITDNDGESIKLETLCGNLIVFSMNKIDSTALEKFRLKSAYYRSDGYRMNFDLGLSFPNDFNPHIEVSNSHLYKFKNKYMAGIGVGVKKADVTYATIFTECKYLLSKKSSTPYLNLRGGLNIPTEKKEGSDVDYIYTLNKEGVFGDLSAGISIHSRSNHCIHFIIGFQIQYLKFIDMENQWWNENRIEVIREEFYKRAYVGFGIELY